jgi:starvation-inducible outer membrane lipoprotein
MRTVRSALFATFSVMLAAAILVPAARAERSLPTQEAARDARTAAQRKINPRVLSEIYRRRGDAEPASVPLANRAVRIDRHGRALVDVRAQVRPELQKKIRALGGVVVSASRAYDSIVGWMPLLTLERLAADPNVRAIEPAQ